MSRSQNSRNAPSVSEKGLSSASTNVFDVESFSFSFGDEPVLDAVSFAVARGEFLALIGPNGAGKSTLLKCLDRMLDGGTGAIRLFGQPLASYGRRALARRVGYVPQADADPGPFSAAEFVSLSRYAHQKPLSVMSATDRAVVDEALERTDASRFADRALAELSAGERQRVYIAAALAQEPQVLLLDEPTTFLDYRHQDEILRLLRGINRDQKMTIIMATHDINGAAMASDRALALKQGKVCFDGPPERLLCHEVLTALYETPFVFAPHPENGAPMIVPRDYRR